MTGYKREELIAAHGVQIYHIECRETVTWIEDKMRVLEQTDELAVRFPGREYRYAQHVAGATILAKTKETAVLGLETIA